MKVIYDGQTVFYSNGNGSANADAPPIVFVHGAGFDHAVWVMPARHFARRGFRVIALDLPAHGRSDGPALTSIAAMAEWLNGLFKVLDIDQVRLVGHSMGSLVALEFAASFGDCVHSIALLGSATPMSVGPPLLNAAKDNHAAAFDMANLWSHSTQGRLGANANPGLSNFVSGKRWLERVEDDVYFADLSACNEYVGAEAVDCPALVVAGGADKMTPAAAGMHLASQLDAIERVVLPGAGHSMLAEQPNQVLDALVNFFVSD